ncbi:MAG: hypothetical protein JRN45_11235 [Nitrososphaerota archaeon]|nr:hypothetical protein [Nitrososphaerota archaeon]
MQRPVNASEDTNTKTAQLVKLISEIGPDIPEISRRLGQFKESVRYRYKEKVINKGFVVQAAVDHEKLGLKRLILVADFEQEYRQYANAILTAMSELCYLVYFARTLPDGHYIVIVAVPTEYVNDYSKFVHSLRNKGLFSSVELLEFDWARNPPMKSEFYDFDVGRWDSGWSAPVKQDYSSSAFFPSKPEKFDYTDLLILKELQKDASKTLTEIATQLKVNYKKLAWHHATHVLGRGLIKSYRLNWMGTRYDYKLEKALQRKHRYMEIVVVVRNVNEWERAGLIASANRLPFLWFEAGGKNYYADFAFPIDTITEAFEYLLTALAPFKGRYDYHIIDTSNALTFTIAYQLYNQESKRWELNSQESLSGFDELLMRIKATG